MKALEDPRRPVKVIVEEAAEFLTAEQISDYLLKARQRELLTETERGIPGGHRQGPCRSRQPSPPAAVVDLRYEDPAVCSCVTDVSQRSYRQAQRPLQPV